MGFTAMGLVGASVDQGRKQIRLQKQGLAQQKEAQDRIANETAREQRDRMLREQRARKREENTVPEDLLAAELVASKKGAASTMLTGPRAQGAAGGAYGRSLLGG